MNAVQYHYLYQNVGCRCSRIVQVGSKSQLQPLIVFQGTSFIVSDNQLAIHILQTYTLVTLKWFHNSSTVPIHESITRVLLSCPCLATHSTIRVSLLCFCTLPTHYAPTICLIALRCLANLGCHLTSVASDTILSIILMA